jgi:hypothetical protein
MRENITEDKIIKKISVICLNLIMCIIFCACGGGSKLRNQSPDDSLSKIVKDRVGDDVFYIGKTEEKGVTIYTYIIKKDEKKVFYDLVDAINEGIKNIDKKITVTIGSDPESGMMFVNSELSNFYDKNNITYIRDNICRLRMVYQEYNVNKIFDDVKLYNEINSLEVLQIDKEIKEKADKEGIDWNKVWPELEQIEVDNSDWED